ncbi:MAG: ATP-binding protein [Syntrophales bacterium]|nr:ATP-binding protein [Syntrophales bacterium]
MTLEHRGDTESSRVENIPYIAIEEAVVNAVYHRGYDVREPVEIRIMHDELVVLSYPGPDRSVRLEQLRVGKAMPRRYRNRRIGEFLKELEFTEGRSTGIPKIIDAMQANGSPPAEFDFDEDHSYFMIRLPVHPAALEVADSEVGESADVDTPQVTGQGGTKSAPSRNPEPMQGREAHRRSDGNSKTYRPHQVSEPSLEPASQCRIAGDDHSRQASQQQAEI